VSSIASAPKRAAPGPDDANAPSRGRWPGISINAAIGCGLAAAFALVAFVTTGGTDLGPNTSVEIGLVAVGVVLAAGVVVLGAPGRAGGGMTLLLFAALVALTFASIAWSVQPDDSWVEGNRTLSYLAAFGAAMALARLIPGRWPAVLGAVATAATVVCAYALLTKVFPATLDANDLVGRLKTPFSYWNATGLMAALGLAPCIWAGAHPTRGWVLRTLSVPALAILLAVLVLSYSRGALIAAIVACGCWFVLTPMRLRAALVLGLGGAGGAALTLWALTHHALTHDRVPLPSRTSAGHTFGVVLLVVLAVLTIAGFAAAVALDRVVVAARIRRRVGIALVVAVALVPLGGVVAVAASSRGLTGEASHIWSTLTSTNGGVNESPGRLIELSNSRPRYWRQGLKVGEHSLVKGVGAGGFQTARTRYSTDALVVGHAHSYLIETFADFGLIGTLLSLALLAAWGTAAVRTLGFNRRRGPPATPAAEHAAERIGLMTMLAVVVTFGIHSAIDWTWFFPGVAVPALFCAGWLAARGPLSEPVGRLEAPKGLTAAPAAAGAVVAIAAIAIATVWVIWQPLRSSNADAAAVAALIRGDARSALANARTAVSTDPVSADALWELSEIDIAVGDLAGARTELTHATSRQPQNPETWERLGEFDLRHHQPRLAVSELSNAARLDLTALQPLWDLATGYAMLHNSVAARSELAAAATRQPRPDAWERLGAFDLRAHATKLALGELQAALTIEPSDSQARALANKAQAELNATAARAAAAAKAAARHRRAR
jgi:tetratricopeptide (TPR) repeat protein